MRWSRLCALVKRDAMSRLPIMAMAGRNASASVNSERVAEGGIERTVSRKGRRYDNALAEAINGLSEAEVIHRPSSIVPCRG